MNEAETRKLLEFCGWKWETDGDMEALLRPDGSCYYEICIPTGFNYPEITYDFLFRYFVPAWNKKNSGKRIHHVMVEYSGFAAQPPVVCTMYYGFLQPPEFAQGDTEAEAFLNTCLKLLEGEK